MLLAIDTCGAVGGVALGEALAVEYPMSQNRDAGHPSGFNTDSIEFRVVAARELAGKTYSELLLSTIAELLREANVTLEQLTGLVIVHGPGSFTGIRIGVSAAKGLAEALAIPVVAISRLELVARQTRGGSAAAVLDAGRGEFYVGLYGHGVREAEVLLTRDMLALALADSGLPLRVCEERVFESLQQFEPKLVPAPVAADALRVGAERFREGLFDDVSTLDANYLRRSETEMLARIAEHAARALRSSAE